MFLIPKYYLSHVELLSSKKTKKLGVIFKGTPCCIRFVEEEENMELKTRRKIGWHLTRNETVA